MLPFDKDVLISKWFELSKIAIKTFQDKITAADLERVKGNANMLVQLVEEKLGISREEAQKKVTEILSQINQQDLKLKAEQTVSKVIDTAHTVLDLINEKMKKK